MSWNYRIDEERRFVITAAWDRLTGSEVIEHQRKLLNDTRFQRDFFQLLDFAGVIDFQMDRANVAELARFDLFSAKSRRAFFAPTPLAYGMSRMFIAFREASGQEQMQVFRDHNEALLWLGLHDSRMTAQ
jgi:hypothetical protein